MNRVLKGHGEQVLYLDFDGVLHHENCYWKPGRGAYLVAPSHYRLFQHVDLLVDLLSPYPHLKIVLSTSWVRRLRFSHTAKRLPPPLRSRVIGATFHTCMDENEFIRQSRGMQIWNDVARRKPAAWLALDDDDENWPDWCVQNLVKTHETEGISSVVVASEIANQLHRFSS